MSAMLPARLGPLDGEIGAAVLDPTPDLQLEPSTAAQLTSLARAAKRVLDLVGALAGLVCLTPVLVAVASLVKLTSRGPILFRQVRLGRDGNPFHCLKFRTMIVDAEAQLKNLESLNESAGGVLFKIKQDPRVTPLGRFLRKTSLDELPQLWNVVRGEMSLVGPRPLQVRDCDKLREAHPLGFRQRLDVTPGITGPWQVGGRSETTGEQMLAMDLEYVQRWSLGLDLAILARTVVVVLVGRGAC